MADYQCPQTRVSGPIQNPTFFHRPLAFWLIAAALVAAESARPLVAATNAIIPYSAVEKLLRAADQADSAKLVVQVRISSAKVRPSEMHLTIQSASSGAIIVKLGPGGEVRDFPRTAQLRRENPAIITDQPQGTLSVSLNTELAGADIT